MNLIFKKFISIFFKKKSFDILKLEKSKENPIIEPKRSNSWEALQTFNPATLYINNKVHFLYRAVGEGNFSVFGYAESKDGINISKRLEKPVYFLGEDFLESLQRSEPANFDYSSGGSIFGCEDPRMVEIDNNIYMTHTSFSNWSHLRMTLSSIKKEDFLKKNWHKWNKPVFISPPGEIHKNWVIFPEKINGKFAILHSISPKLSIEYFHSLTYFNGRNFIHSHYSPSNLEGWEGQRKGAGPPPIKTKDGWLLFYHAIGKDDPSKYKIGAMLLDLKNPEKIIASSKEPVLEPDSEYENNGVKGGIIYSCGAVVIKKNIFLYYGGADTVTCLATASLDSFVKSLKEKDVPKFKKIGPLKKLKNYVFNRKI